MSSFQGPQKQNRAGRPDEYLLGAHRENFERRLAGWDKIQFSRRLHAGQSSLWVSGPAAEITNRLGWLALPESMRPRLNALRAFGDEIRAEGCSHVVLLGMGGSSLAPELYQKTFGNAPGYPELIVLDSTHPAAVAAVESAVDLTRTLFVVSSKSGTTIEPLSFFRYFWAKVRSVEEKPGRHFVAISDPGTPLQTLARDMNFRRAFAALPDVGGRYSALTDFGLLPAALIGADIRALLSRARIAAENDDPSVPADRAPGLRLGAALGELALAGLDKLTIRTSPRLRSFPDWVEQLVAESTGKDGIGIVPVADEPPFPATGYGQDRVFVVLTLEGDADNKLEKETLALEKCGRPLIRIHLEDKAALGREIYRWEIATAAAASVLGVHPFNQPDVEMAKELARKAMAAGAKNGPDGAAGAGVKGRSFAVKAPFRAKTGAPDESVVIDAVEADCTAALRPALADWLATARPRDYVALQAYLPPVGEIPSALQEIRRALLKKTGLATTLGFGPRFLHSTGQLHKGGPDEALVLQIVDRPEDDIPVPETDYTFGGLIRAQAAGDFLALKRRGRRVLQVDLGRDVPGGLRKLGKALGI